MDRAPPCGNKLCAKRVEQRRLEMHRTRVRNVKPLVDTSQPVVTHMDHVRNNLKREQMLEERYSEIDRENRILLHKMCGIMKQPVNPPTPARPPGPQSLNRDARKKELLRITRDNQTILRRIQQAQPVYNHVEFEGTHRRNLGYLKNCAEFPLALRSARGPRSELVLLAGATQEQRPQSARSSRAPAGVEDNPDPRDAEIAYVLKEGIMMGGTYYLVEMATDGRTLSITAFDGETNTTLELVLKETPFRRVYRETKGDYSMIAQRLAVEGNKLVLVEGGAPPASAHLPQAEGRHTPDEMDAEAMVVYRVKPDSPGSVNAEINLGGSDDPQVRFRGLTPASTATSRHNQRTPGDRWGR
mmetsp:Transcript_20070/g.40729  ORF Transcript_20070/g.40729 Transcript_20070/m.40729 type:complete len:357 (-) Transcript_20070:183-1253(-)